MEKVHRTYRADLLIVLKSKIEQSKSGLTIVDDGAERSVDSGFIDIAARVQSLWRRLFSPNLVMTGEVAVCEDFGRVGSEKVKAMFKGDG